MTFTFDCIIFRMMYKPTIKRVQFKNCHCSHWRCVYFSIAFSVIYLNSNADVHSMITHYKKKFFSLVIWWQCSYFFIEIYQFSKFYTHQHKMSACNMYSLHFLLFFFFYGHFKRQCIRQRVQHTYICKWLINRKQSKSNYVLFFLVESINGIMLNYLNDKPSIKDIGTHQTVSYQ